MQFASVDGFFFGFRVIGLGDLKIDHLEQGKITQLKREIA